MKNSVGSSTCEFSLEFASFRILQENHPTKTPAEENAPPLSTSRSLAVSIESRGLHFGQRKLLLSEVELLTALERSLIQNNVSAEAFPIIIYAGAANGSHLPFVFNMFPRFRWILVDPDTFNEVVFEYQRQHPMQLLQVINEYMTDELAVRLMSAHNAEKSDNRFVLISDIRTGARTQNVYHAAVAGGSTAASDIIVQDNALQLSLIKQFGAQLAVSMLKFHPPYPTKEGYDESFPYFRGRPLFGVWAPVTSTEVRLVVTRSEALAFFGESRDGRRDYPCRKFEEQLFHYNTTNRFYNDVKAEQHILETYVDLLKMRSEMSLASSPSETERKVCTLSRDMSAFLGYPGFHPLFPHAAVEEEKKKQLEKQSKRAAAPGGLGAFLKVLHVEPKTCDDAGFPMDEHDCRLYAVMCEAKLVGPKATDGGAAGLALLRSVAGKQLVTAERLARNEVEADPRVPPAIQFALKKPRSIMHYYGIKQKRLRDEKEEPVEDSRCSEQQPHACEEAEDVCAS